MDVVRLEKLKMDYHRKHLDYKEKLLEEITKCKDLEYPEAVERLHCLHQERGYPLNILYLNFLNDDPVPDIDDGDDDELQLNDELALELAIDEL